jgi:hypothetical protein
MAILREATKEVICKIVYHGAGRSGKTTSLLHMNHRLAPGQRGQFITLETPTERTLFFDLLPVKVLAGGYSFRYLLFATPGQEYYHASRRLVLKGADAIVFVVDSQRERAQDNWESWEILEKNLKELGQRADALPLVLQYNKRDLSSAMPLEEMERRYNVRRSFSFPAIARTGQGVYETFLTAAKLALTRLSLPGAESQMGELFHSLVISDDDGERLAKQLAKLNIESGATASLLVEESSGIIASSGILPAGDQEALGAILACNFMAAQELAGNLAGASFAGTIQRGRQWVLRSMRVDQRRFVVTACGRGAASRKVRDAMLYARGALGAQLKMVDQMSPNRLRQAHEVFSSVTAIAVHELGKS